MPPSGSDSEAEEGGDGAGAAAGTAAGQQGCEGGDEGEEEEDDDDGLPPLQQNNNRKVRRVGGEQRSTARRVWGAAGLAGPGRCLRSAQQEEEGGYWHTWVNNLCWYRARMLAMQSMRCMTCSCTSCHDVCCAWRRQFASLGFISAACTGSPQVLLGNVGGQLPWKARAFVRTRAWMH